MRPAFRMMSIASSLAIIAVTLAPSALAWFPTAASCTGVYVVPEHPGTGVYDQACVGTFNGLGETCNGVFVGPHVNFDDQPGDEPELWLAAACVGQSSACSSAIGVMVRKDGSGGFTRCVPA